MAVKYSPSTGGYYPDQIYSGPRADRVPADVVEITAAYHQQLLDGQSSGQKVVPDANGFPVLESPPPPTLAEQKTALIDATRGLAEQHITAGYTSDALGTLHTYPGNRDYQINIIGAKEAGQSLTFLCADSNGVWARRMHTATELAQVFADGVARKSAILDAMDQIIADIDAAADQAELDAVDINVGWPA